MLSPQEERQLKLLLEFMRHDPYYHRPRLDVSHRLRDPQGRFLPRDHNLMDEYKFGEKGELRLQLNDIIYEDEPPRKIKLIKKEGSYGTYQVEEKLNAGDIVAGIAFVAVLLASFFN